MASILPADAARFFTSDGDSLYRNCISAAFSAASRGFSKAELEIASDNRVADLLQRLADSGFSVATTADSNSTMIYLRW